MHKNYIIEILILMLLGGLIAVAIRYPRQVLVNLPLEIIKFPFKRLWSRIMLPLEIFPGLLSKRTWRKIRKVESKMDVRINDEDDVQLKNANRKSSDSVRSSTGSNKV